MAHSACGKADYYTNKMKATILAVGTELTSGQITNRNTTWISQRLSVLGLQTETHLTVPDNRAAILEALQFLEKKSQFIFVTGGLGPTSDDFTRELIAEWAEQKTQFHEPSWKKIQDRLSSRGLPIGEFQKQQCYFPFQSQILENSLGTANAFYLKKQTTHLWALPGPPNEIAVVWNEHIQSQLSFLTKDLNPYLTLSWDALGIGEAIAPTLVEPAVKGSGAEIGYRVHMPYLEIKFSYYKSEYEKMKPYIAKLDASLKKHTVSRNGEDILHPLDKILTKVPDLFVFDEVTLGLLTARLQSIRKTNYTFTTQAKTQAPDNSWQIICEYIDEISFRLILESPSIKENFNQIIESPAFSKGQQMSERRRQYFSEMALIKTVQHWNHL